MPCILLSSPPPHCPSPQHQLAAAPRQVERRSISRPQQNPPLLLRSPFVIVTPCIPIQCHSFLYRSGLQCNSNSWQINKEGLDLIACSPTTKISQIRFRRQVGVAKGPYRALLGLPASCWVYRHIRQKVDVRIWHWEANWWSLTENIHTSTHMQIHGRAAVSTVAPQCGRVTVGIPLMNWEQTSKVSRSQSREEL